MAGVSVFGAAPAAGLVPFAEPEQGDDFVLKEHEGATLILDVVGVIQKETKLYGVKPAVELTRVVSLKAGREPQVFSNVLLFQSAPVSQLRASAGQTVVAEVVSYATKQGGTAYKLGPTDPAGLSAAQKFIDAEG